MQFQDKIQNGVRYLLDGGHTDLARWLLEKMLGDFPDLAEAHFELAQLAHADGDDAYAERHFRQATELARHDAKIQKGLGDFLYVVHQQPQAALEQYKTALALQPDNIETLLTMAHLHVSLHHFDDAADYYRKVLAQDPGHAEARQILDKLTTRKTSPCPDDCSSDQCYAAAGQLLGNGRHEEAMDALNQTLAIDPGHAMAHNDLGVLCFEKGDMENANKHYERAAELAPDNITIQKNLGDFYYFQRGDVQSALKKYVQVLTHAPEDTEVLINTGHICMALNQVDDARVFFQRVLEIEPWHQDADALLQQLDPPAAVTQTSSEPSVDLYAAAVEKSGLGDAPGAIGDLALLVSQDPSHALAFNDLGVLHYEQGNKDEALRCYEQAARLQPENTIFLKNLADFYFVEQGRVEDALKAYIRILEMDREDVDCLMAAGTICLAVNQPADARTFFERVLQIEPWHTQAGEQLHQLDGGGLPSAAPEACGRMAP
ncbi:MAG: tetratricopeptide repeat protein [Desulfatitalea sp.]|nr:tetratricopeptide repeat protein [Desulfatitalea sp.]NNK00318.1 tetratricopeptide repeat protein [Desulfatitalea sp.]